MKPSASILLALALATLSAGSAFADGPKDNIITNVRPIPPVGVEVPQADREAIEKGLQELKAAIEDAKKAQAKNPQLADLLPDVEVFHKAVDWALRYQLFSKPPEIKLAFEQLTEGKSRAEALKKGDAPWTVKRGSWFEPIAPGSMALCSPTAWSFQTATTPAVEPRCASTSGSTAAARRSASSASWTNA
ncbi:hypothetical protein [Verrucomicrobium spinosum]|uniref:hypothetical protein n=1 Tax=Verrucomicrobium spinosum TaxID=2736 RepID=UPI0009468104|nr:hypothetical protein [Verrucomicrobium spinosum]